MVFSSIITMENQRVQSLRPQRGLNILRKSAKDIHHRTTTKHREVQNRLASIKYEENKAISLTSAKPYNKATQQVSLFSKYRSGCKFPILHLHANDLVKGEISQLTPSVETEPVTLEGHSSNCSPLRMTLHRTKGDDRRKSKFPEVEKKSSMKKQAGLLAVWMDKMMKKYCSGSAHDLKTVHAAKLINEECFKEALKLIDMKSEVLCSLLKKTLKNKKTYEKSEK